MKILFAAGGTGGHLFPALAVAKAIERLSAEKVEFLFLGSSDRIESRKVPESGYAFRAIPVPRLRGIFSLENLKLPFELSKAVKICEGIIRDFRADVAVGAGAYVSYPPCRAAIKTRTPLVLMESNVNPGKTNKFLANRADLILLSFEETKKYLPRRALRKTFVSGNPVREEILKPVEKNEALSLFGLSPEKKTVLALGGSLGARTINEAVESRLDSFAERGIQLIWQTGANYSPKSPLPRGVVATEFIDDMASAYSAADFVLSRAGASAVAEIAALGKPSALVPLPSASNDEQTLNALALRDAGGAVLILDQEARYRIDEIFDILEDESALERLSENARKIGKPKAAETAAKKIIDLMADKN